MEMNKLYTLQGENFSPERPALYPRPQLRREHWLSLDGQWEFAVSDTAAFPKTYDRAIQVPFAPESLLSGIGEHFGEDQLLYYRRSFCLPKFPEGGRVLLHFGAVDQTALVRLNGQEIGSHEGGYLAFTLEITAALREGENCLEVQVTDDLRKKHFLYGKQRLDRGGMWYTPVSGIWQSVWLEWVPQVYVPKLKIRTKGNRVFLDTGDASLEGTLCIQGGETELLQGGKAEFAVENPRFWSPEDPYLYEFTLQAGQDRVASYFALRDLSIEKVDGLPRLCLNGKPYFFHGLLDQGYWPDGIYTPADPSCFEEDILRMKALGFNTLRKHIKIEPEQFYYDCDRLGMIVFQDMVNNGKYHFIKDTALPTIGLQKCSDRRRHRDPLLRKTFLESMEATVEQLFSHPCICYWTIFNEGWGQFESTDAYRLMKTLDDSRFIDSTSGWFRCGESDVESIHIYFKPLKFQPSDKPLVLSEFGGYAYAPKEHSFNPHKVYGYAKYEDVRTYGKAVEELYGKLQPWLAKGLCAAIYTQVSDVEDETNGILTYDRKICKLQPEQMLPIAERLKY